MAWNFYTTSSVYICEFSTKAFGPSKFKRDSSMKSTTTLLAILATVFSLSLAACNTVEGVGEDIGSAGNAIDEAAEDSKN